MACNTRIDAVKRAVKVVGKYKTDVTKPFGFISIGTPSETAEQARHQSAPSEAKREIREQIEESLFLGSPKQEGIALRRPIGDRRAELGINLRQAKLNEKFAGRLKSLYS